MSLLNLEIWGPRPKYTSGNGPWVPQSSGDMGQETEEENNRQHPQFHIQAHLGCRHQTLPEIIPRYYWPEMYACCCLVFIWEQKNLRCPKTIEGHWSSTTFLIKSLNIFPFAAFSSTGVHMLSNFLGHLDNYILSIILCNWFYNICLPAAHSYQWSQDWVPYVLETSLCLWGSPIPLSGSPCRYRFGA